MPAWPRLPAVVAALVRVVVQSIWEKLVLWGRIYGGSRHSVDAGGVALVWLTRRPRSCDTSQSLFPMPAKQRTIIPWLAFQLFFHGFPRALTRGGSAPNTAALRLGER